MAVKLDKVIGRLREKDDHKCAIEVSCAVPQITLEMQLRKVTEYAVGNRKDKNGFSLGTNLGKRPVSYSVFQKTRGEWVVYLRYFGDATTLEYPKIGIIRKSHNTSLSQTVNPNYGVEGAPNAEVEIYVHKVRTNGWKLMYNQKNQPILFDLPANEGEWTPLMQVDEFVQQFIDWYVDDDGKIVYANKFNNSKLILGNKTKWTENVIYNGKDPVRAIFLRVGLAVVQERTFIDPKTDRESTAYTYGQPVYFSLRYAPLEEDMYKLQVIT